MNIQSYLQQGLLDWFNYNPEKFHSLQTVGKICQEIYLPYCAPEEVLDAKYKILYPLIRRGFIEFYGNDNLRLAPTNIIYNTEFVLALNVPTHIINELETQPIFSIFNRLMVYVKSENIIKYFVNNGIPSCEFQFQKVLASIPSLQKIIGSWEDDLIVDIQSCWILSEKGTWLKPSLYPTIGIFRKGEKKYHSKSVRLSDHKWKHIPEQKTNIDAFAIAALWNILNGTQDLRIKYDQNTGILNIDNNYFPLLIERLLYINSLLIGNFTSDLHARKYKLSMNQFNIFNKLLNKKIKVYE